MVDSFFSKFLTTDCIFLLEIGLSVIFLGFILAEEYIIGLWFTIMRSSLLLML